MVDLCVRALQAWGISIEIVFGVAELWCPNLACGAQGVQRHPRTTGLASRSSSAWPNCGARRVELTFCRAKGLVVVVIVPTRDIPALPFVVF